MIRRGINIPKGLVLSNSLLDLLVLNLVQTLNLLAESSIMFKSWSDTARLACSYSYCITALASWRDDDGPWAQAAVCPRTAVDTLDNFPGPK